MRKLVFILTVLSMMVFSCDDEKDDSNNNDEDVATLNIKLTDAPAEAYEAVNVEILKVQVHSGDNENDGEWHDLDVMNTGIYNLLEFNNGLDTLIGSAELPAGQISQMRLYLGENNTVVKEGETYDLNTTAGERSGLKLQIHVDFEPGVSYNIWIDFDASRSVISRGNNKYNLKPVIRAFTEVTTGAIKGYVNPKEALPYLLAVNGTDSVGTIADTNGFYLLRGIPAGEWNLHVNPVDGYKDTTIEKITVELGKTAILDTIKLVSL